MARRTDYYADGHVEYSEVPEEVYYINNSKYKGLLITIVVLLVLILVLLFFFGIMCVGQWVILQEIITQ